MDIIYQLGNMNKDGESASLVVDHDKILKLITSDIL